MGHGQPWRGRTSSANVVGKPFILQVNLSASTVHSGEAWGVPPTTVTSTTAPEIAGPLLVTLTKYVAIPVWLIFSGPSTDIRGSPVTWTLVVSVFVNSQLGLTTPGGGVTCTMFSMVPEVGLR